MPEKSIAVLPFTNMSTTEENAFFADGVQEEILTNLAKIARMCSKAVCNVPLEKCE